jgi:hypothetical protein
MNDKPALDHLARRVAGDDWYLSTVLTAYQNRHRLDDAALAALLGVTVRALTGLLLCRRPGTAASYQTAEEDITDIAGLFGIDPAALRRVVCETAGS